MHPIPNAAIATLALTLAACSQAPAAPTRDGGPQNAVRMTMPEGEALPGAVDANAAPVWAGSGDGLSARFGHAGQTPLVSLACRDGVLVVTRHAYAPLGAQALFALVGSEGIVRLAMDATSIPGQRGYLWQGALAASDARAKVLGGAYTGTLPGAGMIKVSGSGAARDVISHCRAIAPSVAPEPVEPTLGVD